MIQKPTTSKTFEKVSWHTKSLGNPETAEEVVERFWVITDFLQRNGLTLRTLAQSKTEIDDDFAIMTGDLSEKGFQFMAVGYQRWLQRLDTGATFDNELFLQKQLKKMP